jgi:hypothetical protein
LSEPWRGPDERHVLKTLTLLAGSSRVYLLQLEEARPVIERLSEDYGPAALLVTSLAAADGRTLYLGTPRHIEQLARSILKDLPDP